MPSAKFAVRFLREFISRFKGLLFLGIIIGLLAFLALNTFGTALFGRSTEAIGMTGRFHTEELPASILSLVSDGLTTIDESGEISPALAESWVTTDNGKTWKFTLAKGRKWQDGKEVVSGDIKYNFEDVQIERPNPNEVIFTLSQPFAPFPSVVSRPTFKKGLLGVGEWKVTNISLAGAFVETLVLENKNRDRRIIKFYPSEERTKLAFKLGEVDKITEIIDPKPLDSWTTTLVDHQTNKQRFVAVFFNYESALLEGAKNKSIRQGLSYAIDKSQFGQERAIGPISPNSWAHNPQIKTYDFSLERAKELLNDLPKAAKNITLTTTPFLLETAEKIALDWEKVGFKVNVQVASSIPTDYQAFLVIYDTPIDPDQYATWHSTQDVTNIANYSNPRIDKLLEDGRLALDVDERRSIYLDFQRFLLEDAPAVFLYHPTSYTITRK